MEAYEKVNLLFILIDYLTEQFPDEFMISIASFKSSPIQHVVQFVNYGAI